MSIDFKTFLSIIPHVVDARYPILTRGRHGIGKSTLVYQLAKQLDLEVVERRASQMTEGDLLGLPKVENNVTQWLAPEWLHTACNKPVILFLDEVDRATMEVRQGIFELCDSRKIAGYTLHPDTLIFAAVNGGEHGAQYQVGEMDPAELDRYTVFDVEPTIEDWLAWAKTEVCDEIWNFINQNHQHLEHREDYEPNKVYPSRRSWERLSKTLNGLDKIEHSPTLYHLSTAFVGFEAAIALNDFIKNYDRQVTVEDIIDDGKLELTKDWKINDHNALIEKIKAKETFAEKLTDNRLQNVANYFVTLPSEVAMSLWQAMGNSEFATHNVSRLHGMTASNGIKIQEYIVEILTAK
tara:strand:- start:755 stop:1810 length:1056 start_codon:yes stop_codon:yes gene_type:complete